MMQVSEDTCIIYIINDESVFIFLFSTYTVLYIHLFFGSFLYYCRMVFNIKSLSCCSVGSCNLYLETNICSSIPAVAYCTSASFLFVTNK